MDKTGTITAGKPRVVDVQSFCGWSAERLLVLAAAINSHSEHPIAKAILEAAAERDLQVPTATGYRSIAGQGVEGVIEGLRCFVGNHRMVHDAGLCNETLESKLAEIEEKGLSLAVVCVSDRPKGNGQVLGVIAIGDSLRADAREALRDLHAVGLERIVMLSGDNQRTVDAIARQAGIDEAFGDLLPDEKVARLRAMLDEHHHVGMIGDGVNDAPALAVASVGIAMGAIGSDTAIETADVALMQDDLGKLAEAIAMGRRTLGMIRFNIGFALLVKAVFLTLAFTGHASLWMAILADTGATLLVVGNSLRLLAPPRES